jgi:hypothetical protein
MVNHRESSIEQDRPLVFQDVAERQVLAVGLPCLRGVNLVASPGIEVDVAFSISTKFGRPI